MQDRKNNKGVRRLLLRLLGILLCTVPVCAAVISYFPAWRAEGGEVVISGFTVLLLALCFVPLWNTVRKALASPAAHTMWFIAFLIFFTMSKIADEMTVISFVGFLGNGAGAICFRLARRGDLSEGHRI